MSSERGPEGREGQVGREGTTGREGIAGPPGERGDRGPRGNTGRAIPSRIVFSFVAVTTVAAIITGIATTAYLTSRHNTDEIRAYTQTNCREIEARKLNDRNAAWSNFNALDYNLRVLGVKKTPEVVRAAKYSRDLALARYAPAPCPRRFVSIKLVPIQKPPSIPPPR